MLIDADRIESIAQLVGDASLPAHERLALRLARLLREAVLAQSTLSESDQYTSPAKQSVLLALVLDVHDRMQALLRAGVPIDRLDALDLAPIMRAGHDTPPDGVAEVQRIGQALARELDALEAAPS
jgi:V/A-type H+-transporting ATPase subunit A